MLKKIIDTEQQRLKALGYDSVITPISIEVTTNLHVENIGNDVYVLDSLILNEDGLINEEEVISILSPIDCFKTQQVKYLKSLGNTIHKTFRNWIICKLGVSLTDDLQTEPYRLNFIKISPIIH
jgi:hypothetical protein